MKGRKGTEGCAFERRNPDVDWKTHADWCAYLAKGNARDAYIETCRRPGADQFQAIQECQARGSVGAAWQGNATRAEVNAYMVGRVPRDCTVSPTSAPKVIPAPPVSEGAYYVIGRFTCASPDGGTTGQVVWTSRSSTCNYAKEKLLREAEARGGICASWDPRWGVIGSPQWTQDGPCREASK